ncbi:hypothetical protein CDAR_119981 [Caerostris darwini]|uniref:Uncharacterized protein n=1 Tax=Caerostris darwini TaxID=1538125 RepID=A0AAV4T0Z0_9ARAC|nr:hypothetical protein CDAR_119981 [Caerostris darwini]
MSPSSQCGHTCSDDDPFKSFNHYLTRMLPYGAVMRRSRMGWDSSISKSFLKRRLPFLVVFRLWTKALGGGKGGVNERHLHNNEVDEISWNCNKHGRKKVGMKMIFGARHSEG